MHEPTAEYVNQDSTNRATFKSYESEHYVDEQGYYNEAMYRIGVEHYRSDQAIPYMGICIWKNPILITYIVFFHVYIYISWFPYTYMEYMEYHLHAISSSIYTM